MNRIKRQRTVSQSGIFLEAFKKKKNSIENLSIKIFYEIFDYLDGYDIYKAFSNLNIHFENLLISSSSLMKIEISSTTTLDSDYKQFIKSNKHHIISLYFDGQIILDKFITFFQIDLLFLHLESLTLHQISTSQLLILLFYLKSLSRLTSLDICLNDCNANVGHIYQMIFRLPLRYVNFAIVNYDRLNVTLPIATDDQYSSIEHLVIDHCFTLKELIDILSYAPRLSHLRFFSLFKLNNSIKTEMIMKLSNLVHLSIDMYGSNFDEFEDFLIKLCSQLQFLRVKIQCSDSSYLNGDRWEELISQKLTSLTTFIFNYIHLTNYDCEIDPSHALLNRFTSPFWIKRKWIFKISLESNKLIYSIRPYKKTWIDFQEYEENDSYSISNSLIDVAGYSSMIQFSVRDTLPMESEDSLLDKIHLIFNMIQITSLSIRCDQVSVNMFINILNSLPNLNAIRISDLPLHEKLYKYDRNTFLKNNKITKLTLRNILNLKQIDLVIDLFHRIHCLSLQHIPDLNIESVLRYTLLKIKEKNVSYLRMICVFSLEAQYDKLQKLKQMIDDEHLLKDYTINRRLNRFYIQWK